MIFVFNKYYLPEMLFLPTRKGGGKLMGLEIISYFVGIDNAATIPTSAITSRLSNSQEILLFRRKLELLDKCQFFFVQQQVTAWINITPVIAAALLEDKDLLMQTSRFSFLELTINENFPELDCIDRNHPLVCLKQYIPLIMADYGAGDSSSQAIFSGLFRRVIMNKHFIQHQLPMLSFAPFMRAIKAQLETCCESIIVAGVDEQQMLERLLSLEFSAMQGKLWPAVDIASLTSLVQQ